ncbi:Podocan, partial [Corvus brachyrhynchos]
NNQIEEIFPEELARLYRLETLNLQNNRLTSKGLPEEAFEHLENLNYLYLANNKLTVAPKFLPNTLISADFAANYLTKIYGLTFGQKPNLRSVYLHNNKLSDAGLPDNMFNGSNNVEILIMSSNFLKYVPKNLPPALYKLHLQSNKLEKIPKGAFSELAGLRELYLQNNYLSNEGMDNETFWKLSSLEYLDLSSNNLSQIPSGLPRNIVLLHLEKNAIKVIDRDVLTQIKNLEYLLLHNNKLKARGIHPLAFQGLKKLHTVHLYNNMLERIPSGLPRRVKTLMILHNQISEINRNDFATTYFLEELNLSYNKLTSPQIHREAFRKLRQLKSLDLSGNNLHTVPFGFPKNLQVLKLKENEISIIPKGTLSGMTKLRELYLSNNKLKVNSIYSRAWRELSSLQSLDMAGNQLTSIPLGLPESLEYLYLQNNKITMVSENAFESTPKIKGIYLRFNKISVGALKESTFQNLKHLQVLDIEGNLEFSNSSKNKDDSEEEMEDEEEEEEEELR